MLVWEKSLRTGTSRLDADCRPRYSNPSLGTLRIISIKNNLSERASIAVSRRIIIWFSQFS